MEAVLFSSLDNKMLSLKKHDNGTEVWTNSYNEHLLQQRKPCLKLETTLVVLFGAHDYKLQQTLYCQRSFKA